MHNGKSTLHYQSNLNNRNFISIFGSFTLLLILLIFTNFVNPVNAQEYANLEFDDTGSMVKSVLVPDNGITLPTINATMKHTTYVYLLGMSYYVNGRYSGSHIGNYSVSLDSEGVRNSRYDTPYGTWYSRESPRTLCNQDPAYYCTHWRFEPNSTALNELNTFEYIKIDLYYTYNGDTDYDRWITSLYYVRRGTEIRWRSDTTEMETNQSPGNNSYSTHYADVIAYINSESELSFELSVQEGAEDIKKYSLNKSEAYALWAGPEWNYRSDYGSWYVRSFSDCSDSTDGSKCSQILFNPDEDAIDKLQGKKRIHETNYD